MRRLMWSKPHEPWDIPKQYTINTETRPMTPEEKTADEKAHATRAELGDLLKRSLKSSYDAALALAHVSDENGTYQGMCLNNRAWLFGLLSQLNETMQPVKYAVDECRERGTPGYHDKREANMQEYAENLDTAIKLGGLRGS